MAKQLAVCGLPSPVQGYLSRFLVKSVFSIGTLSDFGVGHVS